MLAVSRGHCLLAEARACATVACNKLQRLGLSSCFCTPWSSVLCIDCDLWWSPDALSCSSNTVLWHACILHVCASICRMILGPWDVLV